MSRRTTSLLSLAVVLLASSVAAESWYLWGMSAPTPSTERPVVIGDIDAQTAVEVAAQDAAEIFTVSWRTYRAHLARATALMTDDMASRYRTSAKPVRDRMVAGHTRTATRVAASGVVRAGQDQVLALLFLDQRTTSGGSAPSYTARRALLTMVHTDRGWLVDNVQTR